MGRLLICTTCWTTFYDLSNGEEFECPTIGCEGYIRNAISWATFVEYAPEAQQMLESADIYIGAKFNVPKALQEKIRSRSR